MKLDVTALEQAVQEMEKFWEAYRTEKVSSTPDEDNLSLRIKRAAVIKAFEFTYESAIHLIRRQLSEGILTDEKLRVMNFRDMLRAAADAGLVAEPTHWFNYRNMRNITSHTYDEDKAEEFLSGVEDFLGDVRFLLAELIRRNTS